MAGWEKMADMMAAAYIEVYGIQKWNSLSDRQKHDAIMIMVKDSIKALDSIK